MMPARYHVDPRVGIASPGSVTRTPDAPVIVPLEAALQAVEGAVADVGTRPPAPRVLVARHADFWRFERGLDAVVSPFELVFPVGALTAPGRGLASILLAALRRCPEMAAAAERMARRTAPGAVVGGLARALQVTLAPEMLSAEGARREELARRFIAHVGAVVGVGEGSVEPAERSAQALARLDARARRAQEREIERQRALTSAAREAQRQIASGVDLGPPA
jgi:hypothetical protein